MGLIDEAAPAPAPEQQPTGAPDMIDALRAKGEEITPANMKDAVQRIVLAGQKILYSPETHKMVEGKLKEGETPAEAAGSGIAELMGVLVHESKNTMPKDAVNPAMIILLADVLDYLKQTGRIKGDASEIDAAGKALSEALLQGSGVSPDLFGQIMTKAQSAMQDPNVMATMQQYMSGGGGQPGATPPQGA